MTTKKNKEDEVHGTSVYDMYMKNSSGKDSYLTQIAMNTAYVQQGYFQTRSEGDGYEYHTDEQATITLVSPKRTLIFKLSGIVV